LALGSAAADTMVETARTQAWDTQNLDALKALFSDKASVNAFIMELFKKLNPQLLDIDLEPENRQE
jgi:hypothetical protein